MERVLNQEEIDRMVRMARGKEPDISKAAPRSIKPCSFRQAGQLSGEQVRALTSLHEGFGKCFTQSLGAYLRVAFEGTLVSVEQLPYSEFLGRVPEITYFVSFGVPQLRASGAIQIDHALVFPLVDILLGGTGQCEIFTREVSEIEGEIMCGVAEIIIRELQASWTSLGFTIQREERQLPSQMQRFLPPMEKTLCLSFEIRVAEGRGMMNVVLPISISNTLLRKLSVNRLQSKAPVGNTPASIRLRERLLDCPYRADLAMPNLRLPAQHFLELLPGQVCNLGVSVRESAALMIAGRSIFGASAVRSGNQRAAHISQRLLDSQTTRLT